MTWTTYDAANPVILDPPAPYEDQITEFRDPFVFWHESTKKWVSVISLTKLHKLAIYTSDNLKEWSFVSEFGPVNAVGGVWECANLFPLPLDGDESNLKWIAQIGLNPGGPPGTIGSGTQYVVGDFNGTSFIPDADSVAPADGANWLDFGPDFYAGLSFNGLPVDERTVIGWMSNWQYAEEIPTDPWRSANSIPRKLSLKTINEKATIVQEPIGNFNSIVKQSNCTGSWDSVPEGFTETDCPGKTLDIDLSFSEGSNSAQFGIIVRATDDLQEQTRIGYDFSTKELFVDRTKSGEVEFEETFAEEYRTELLANDEGKIKLRILVDWSSVEVFGGEGEVVVTAQIFPSDKATTSRLFSKGGSTEDVSFQADAVPSVWN